MAARKGQNEEREYVAKLDPRFRRYVKMLAAQRDVLQKDILNEAIEQYIRREVVNHNLDKKEVA